jgi:hypothetical protein
LPTTTNTCSTVCTCAIAGAFVDAAQDHFGTVANATGNTSKAAKAAVHTKCRTAADLRLKTAGTMNAAARIMVPRQAHCARISSHVIIRLLPF